MQQQKQEELFEEVEVVDGPEEEEDPQETTQVVGDTEGTTQSEEVTGDEDLSEYSETVKKRISKLTNRFRRRRTTETICNHLCRIYQKTERRTQSKTR